MIRGFASFVPFHRTVLRTDRSPADVSAALAQITSVRWLSWSGDGSTFRGTVGPGSFKVTRRIRYRNSFIPVLLGTIESTDRGSLVRIRFRMYAPVIAFMGVWMGMATVAALFGIVASLRTGSLAGLVALAMPVIGATLAGLAFRYEANVATETLCRLWDARETDARA